MQPGAIAPTPPLSSSFIHTCRRFSAGASLFVLVLGLAVLLGWVLDIEVLKSIIPGRVTQKPNTALGLMASGVALLLWHRQARRQPGQRHRWQRLAMVGLPVLIVLLGLLTLAEYGFRVDLGINRLVFVAPSPDAVDAVVGGRPAPNTAINFLLLGSALLVLEKRRYRMAQGLSLGVLLVALLALTGHLYAVANFYRAGSATGMAVHTGVGFLLLALGVMAATADQGWMQNISSSHSGGTMMRRLLPLIFFVPPLIGLGLLLTYDSAICYPEGAVALRSILTTVLFSALVWWNGRSLNQLDAQRWSLQARFTQDLEDQVASRTAALHAANLALETENQNRQQAETNLRESEARNRRAITLAPFPILMHAEDGEILAISQTLTNITGYSAAEIPTIADWTERAYGKRQNEVRTIIDNLYQVNDRVREGEFAVRTKAGDTRIWDFSSAPLGHTPDGRRLVISMASDVTDRKRVEDELAASRAELQRQLAEIETIYRSAPIGLNVLDRDLRFVRINEQLAEMNGYSVEDHIGRSVQELLPDLADTAEALLRPVLETGEPLLDIEIQGETPARPGVQRVWRESFLPLKQGDRIIGINTVCEEITERRQTQLALQAAQSQLEAALETSAVYPWQINIKENRVVTKPGLAQLFGLDPAAASTGFTIEQGMAVIHEGDRPRVEQALQTAIATGDNYRAEFLLCPANGKERWVLSRGKITADGDGNPQELIGVLVDITDRKQAEAALAERAAQQAEVALIGQQALATSDLDELFNTVVQRVTQILRVDYCKLLELLPGDKGLLLRAGTGWQQAVVGQTVVPLGPDSQAGYTLLAHEPTVVEDLRTDTRFNGPKILTQHGVISGMSTVIGDVENHPFGVIGVHTRTRRQFTQNDVNFLQAIANILAESIAQYRSEQEIQQINASLEQRIQERTQQLVDANQELEAFAYSVSHDLRAPLRAVEGLARILQEDYEHCFDDTGREYTQLMIESASQMDRLIQDLLAYSRLGRRDIMLASVSLQAVVDEALQNLAPTTAEITRQEPEIWVDPLPEVIAQRGVLRQVLTNLLTNSLKFIDSDTRPVIHIWAEPRDPWMRLWIEDNGIGIDERHQRRIFRPFERLHGIEAYPGTGIGLAIVQRGIERMGGRVGLESKPGEGSRFWFELPRS